MNKYYLFIFFLMEIFLLSSRAAVASEGKSLLLKPQKSFQWSVDHKGIQFPLFLAGEALLVAKKRGHVQFVYGNIRLPAKAMLVLAKDGDRYVIQNLNEDVVVELNRGSSVQLGSYFEMILRRDLASRAGYVIEQYRPLDLTSHLLKFQRITRARPEVMISYGRRLKGKIDIAKQKFAEASQDSATRKPASVMSDEDLQKIKTSKTLKPRKSLRKRYEEKVLGHTL